MDSLFDLTFYTVTDYGYEQGSHIGLFASREEAEAVAVRYRKEVPGFKAYACDARIIQIPVVGDWEHNHKQLLCFPGTGGAGTSGGKTAVSP